jgi:alanine racemase
MGQTYPYALHVETGMNRLSMSSSESENFNPKDYPHLKMALLMSHLASADIQDHPQNKQQLERFQKIRQRFPHVPASLANSCGIFLGPDYHFDLLRPGIALYGLAHAQQFPELKNSVHVRSKIIHIQDYQAGETLSYGATYRVEKPMRIATLAIGYADGLPADLSGRGWMVGIGDDFAPIVGRITMDLTLADVTHISCVEEEQWASIVNDTHDFLKMSTQCARLPYELLIALGDRLQRSYSSTTNVIKMAS